MPPMALTCGEQIVRTGAKKLGRHVISPRLAMMTGKPLPHMKGRATCHYCGHCGEGCDVGAMFNSVVSTLPLAAATGRMTLRPNSVVREIIVDENTGKAKAACVTRTFEGRRFLESVFVAASRSNQRASFTRNRSTPNDSAISRATPALSRGYFGASAGRLRRILKNAAGQRNAKRRLTFAALATLIRRRSSGRHSGYQCEGGAATPSFPAWAWISGFGSGFKKEVRKFYTAPVGLTVRAEMLPRFENYVEIDPGGVVDAWGVPVLKVHIQHSDNEREMAKDAGETELEILKAAGVEVTYSGGRMTAPGRIIHEVGRAHGRRSATCAEQIYQMQKCRTSSSRRCSFVSVAIRPDAEILR